MAPKSPKSASVHPQLQKAVTATREQRYEEALTYLKEIVDDRPNDEVALGMLASVYADIDMKDRARELYDRILGFNEANPLARLQRGLLDFEEQHIESALAIWEPLLATDHDFVGHFYTAVAMLQLGRRDGVQSLLLTAKRRMPGNHPLVAEVDKLLGAIDTH
jgi:tetratricopeptide (TPR) repeat protein